MNTQPRRERRRSIVPVIQDLESRAMFSAVPAVIPNVAPPVTQANPLVTQLAKGSQQTVSTVPSNGDLNPYGVAFVPSSFPTGGILQPGGMLVSNFNASSNLQGTGSTIVYTEKGDTKPVLFFQGKSGRLTTALGVLQSGFVVVGNMPTTDGTSATVKPGSILVLDRFGDKVLQIHDPQFVNGPWDLTVNDDPVNPEIFVSNVLTGTVVRIDLHVTSSTSIQLGSETVIATGYSHHADPNALEVGPTGLAYNAATDTLFVASTADNKVFSIAHASTTTLSHVKGTLVYQDANHLHGPLGMVLAPNGDLIVANSDLINPDSTHPSELVEFTQTGQFVAQFSISGDLGAPFGIGVGKFGSTVAFAAVNDVTNTVTEWFVK